MSARTDRLNAVLQRALPLVVVAIVLGFGYYWLLQPVVSGYLRSREEARPLESRVKVLEATVARLQGVQWPNEGEALTLFEERVAKDDRVGDVMELLTRAVADSATDRKLRNLAISTGDEAVAAVAGASAGAAPRVRPASAGQAEVIDPRWSLFPYRLTHTLVTLSFDSSFSTIQGFLWRLRDLPTAIEVRTMTLSRALPLMRFQITLLVFQRGDALAPVPAAAAPSPSGPPVMPPAQPSGVVVPNPMAPRVITPRGPGG